MIDVIHLVLPSCIMRLKSDIIQLIIPLLATLIISVIIPEGPAALPNFILLIILDTIFVVFLIAGPSACHSSLKHSIGIQHSAAFDNVTAKL